MGISPDSVQPRWVFGGTVAVLATCAALMLWVDKPLAWALEPLHGGLIRGIVGKVSFMGDSHWYLAAGVLMWGVARGRWPHTARAGQVLFWASALAGLAALALKVTLGRYRPELLFEQGLYGFGGPALHHDYLAWPSGHATTVFAAAVSLSLAWPRAAGFFFSVALFIAAGRCITTVHYLSDVVAGIWLGSATALCCAAYLPWARRSAVPAEAAA